MSQDILLWIKLLRNSFIKSSEQLLVLHGWFLVITPFAFVHLEAVKFTRYWFNQIIIGFIEY